MRCYPSRARHSSCWSTCPPPVSADIRVQCANPADSDAAPTYHLFSAAALDSNRNRNFVHMKGEFSGVVGLVFAGIADPIGSGFIASLARPEPVDKNDPKSARKIRRMAEKLVESAVNGGPWAISQVADRIDGKATAEIQTEQRHRYVIEAPAQLTREQWIAEYSPTQEAIPALPPTITQ